jgi:CopG antitoxin of type II toxin-antitoxin system
MLKKDKKIPDEFKTYEEAAEFWESHDSTEYLDILEEVEIKVDIQKRHYLIELDENSARLLQDDASKKGISASHLASKLVKKELVSAE